MYKIIGVIGGSSVDAKLYEETVLIGEALASFKLPVLCGGGRGVMEAVSKGVKNADGLTIGILPQSKREANEYIDIPISTGIGFARNAIIVNSSDIIIAIDGKFGTLSEIGFALQFEKPLIAYKCEHSAHLNLRTAENIKQIIEFVKENL